MAEDQNSTDDAPSHSAVISPPLEERWSLSTRCETPEQREKLILEFDQLAQLTMNAIGIYYDGAIRTREALLDLVYAAVPLYRSDGRGIKNLHIAVAEYCSKKKLEFAISSESKKAVVLGELEAKFRAFPAPDRLHAWRKMPVSEIPPQPSTDEATTDSANQAEPNQGTAVRGNESANAAIGDASSRRHAVIHPILRKKGLSILDWASSSKVDYHTASNYLNGKTNPRQSTLKVLAGPLGLSAEEMPT